MWDTVESFLDVEEIQKQHPWTLLFADDVMLSSESRDDPQKQVQSWKDWLQQHGLRLNISKTEYMVCGQRIEDGSIRVDGTELNKVDCFKYLGSKVTSTDDIDQEGRARVNAAWMKWKMATVCCQNHSEARRLRSEPAWEAKDSLVGPCEAGYERCTFVYG
ncbi:hypothetical protein RB195_002674 [Necator americanus]|uniref:Reverse transcriptase domain-containing protein n=1 Tax=Necator americanus TaxID=51031 RepID=A0ABR1DK52_NECAM